MRSRSSAESLKAKTTRSSEALDLGIAVGVGAALALGLAALMLFFGLAFGLAAFFFLALEVWMVFKAVESFRSERRSAAGDGT
jgi:hypothetical protein